MDIVTPSDPTSVYRYYDRAGLLLYVGITARATKRQREHNGDKEWWQFVTTQEVEHYPTRIQAAGREKSLIREFRPPFNRQHNPDHESLRAYYLAAGPALPAKSDAATLSPKEAFHAAHGKVPLTQIQAGNVAVFAAGKAFRELLRSAWPTPERVLFLAPRKRGVLSDIDFNGELPQLTFVGERGGIAAHRNVHLHLKVLSHRPFVARIHEAVGDKC